MQKLFSAAVGLAFGFPLGAAAQTGPEIKALREEMDSIRAAYQARMQALEKRLQAAEAAAAGPASGDPSVRAAPPIAAPPIARSQPAPSPTAAAGNRQTGGSNAANPALSLILSGSYTGASQDPDEYEIGGFQLPPDAGVGPGTRGFSLAESELSLAASIDPWFRGAASLALHPDDTVSVEEAFIQTTALGNGLALKAGRFFSGIGYLNPQHAHVWDFVDMPLAYQAMLGTQYGDDGLQLTWVAPTDLFIEFGAELGRGRGFPGNESAGNGAGMRALTAHTGGDIGISQSWRAGLSMLNVKAREQALLATDAGGSRVTNAFSGSTRVWVADAVWKWSPNGNATRTNLKLQGEYLRSTRKGSLTYDLDDTNSTGSFRTVQSGWYLQGVYQFMPRWRVGLRTDRLDPGTQDYGIDTAALASSARRPRKNTLMLDYNPSEFSRVRLQVAQDRAREGIVDNQIFLQYQMSLGAHGAHGY